jgi:hypothetical protein
MAEQAKDEAQVNHGIAEEDTEGHVNHGAVEDDTEGHARWHVTEPSEDDVEGHVVRK